MQKPCERGWWPPIFIRLLFITYQSAHYKTNMGAQWLNGRVLGPQVRASSASLCCVLEQTNKQYKPTGAAMKRWLGRDCHWNSEPSYFIFMEYLRKIKQNQQSEPKHLYTYEPPVQKFCIRPCVEHPAKAQVSIDAVCLQILWVLSYAHRTPNEHPTKTD